MTGRQPGRGLFITFEGIDGCGKSTQARRLAATLEGQGHRVTLTREPGGAPGAEEIRRLLVEGPPARWSPETEVLLFTAARRDHLERTIRPALEAGGVVICDRFADSTRVYQGAARGDLRALVDRLHELTIGIEPDLTLVLDLDVGTARDRAQARSGGEERFEAMGAGFQARLRDGFRALAAEFPDRVHLVDAAGDADALAGRIAALVAPLVSVPGGAA